MGAVVRHSRAHSEITWRKESHLLPFQRTSGRLGFQDEAILHWRGKTWPSLLRRKRSN